MRVAMRDFRRRRLLLDTNILLDAVCKERPQSQEACDVLARCNGGGDIGFATAMSFKDAYYILSRQYGEASGRKLLGLLLGLVAVAPLGSEECLVSFDSNEPDFEDGLVRACAELNDIGFILTRDAAAFRKSTVRAVTCREYLEIVA